MGAALAALLFGCLAVALVALWKAWKVLEWAWLKPRRLEAALRAQGVRGTRYRPLHGDLKENALLLRAARAKPMSLSHDIAPRVAPFFLREAARNGKTSLSWFGPVPRVTITDPELIREIMSNKFGHFEKPEISPLGKLLATGLANYEGEKWARHRRIINPAFHLEKLRIMLPAFAASCDDLIERWEGMSADGEGSVELNVSPEFQTFTGDVISRTAFGSCLEEGRRISRLQNEQGELLVKASQSVYIPGSRFLPTKGNLRRKEIDREVRSILRGIISKKEEAMKVGEARANDDLLGLLLHSSMQDSKSNNGNGLTTEEVIEECKLFYFAGHETTSVLLTWTMVLLSMHPTWQIRAREEVLQVFGTRKPDMDGLNRLKIVTMILYETLRLYPPVIMLSRRTYKPMAVGGITYPEGVMLSLPLILVHHDPELWGEDATMFNPGRFAEGVAKASKNQMAFFSFGWGPRICIGQNFALMEAKMCLSMLLQNFSFELSPSYVHAPYTIITLLPQHGAQIILKKI